MSFADRGIVPPTGHQGAALRLRPLVVADVELDHAAVMSSREFLVDWEQEPPWPREGFTVEENLADIELMEGRHRDGVRFTYTVMNADETECLGCVYLMPSDDPMYRTATITALGDRCWESVDVVVYFWVRVARWPDGLESTLVEQLASWFAADWDLDRWVFMTNAALDHQIATLETNGFRRAFELDRERDLYPSYAYETI